MSHGVQIFVAAHVTLEEFVQEIEALLGVELEIYSDDFTSYYEGRGPGVWFWVGDHTLENDRDLLFEDYKYEVSIEGVRNRAAEAREKALHDFAHSVYEKLKALQKYDLMLTDDVQVKLDEYYVGG
jgi:hypothetical protein